MSFAINSGPTSWPRIWDRPGRGDFEGIGRKVGGQDESEATLGECRLADATTARPAATLHAFDTGRSCLLDLATEWVAVCAIQVSATVARRRIARGTHWKAATDRTETLVLVALEHAGHPRKADITRSGEASSRGAIDDATLSFAHRTRYDVIASELLLGRRIADAAACSRFGE